MTPKEKAKELFDKFEYYVRIYNDDTPRLDMQKQCALIAVDEIIKQENVIVPQLIKIIKTLMEKRKLNESFKSDVNIYWKEVKKEIGNI